MSRIEQCVSARFFANLTITGKSRSATRLAVVCGCFLLWGGLTLPVQAANYIWNTPTSGNWTTAANWDLASGNPDGADDSATISATGSAYTVTLDASKTIGEFAMTSADATLDTGSNILTIDGNAGSTTTPGLFTQTGGVLNGNYRFLKADVNLSNVTSSSPTMFEFLQFTGACCATQPSSIDFGSSHEIKTNQTLKVLTVDSRGVINLTTSSDVTNLGAVELINQGYSGGSNQNHVIWNLNSGSGKLTNYGTVTMASNRTISGNASDTRLTADFTNEAGGVFNAGTLISGQVLLNKTAGTYVNSGDWNVTSGAGTKSLIITGNGASFTQNNALATLDSTRMTFGASGDTVANTFTVSNGSMAGNFEFGRTAVSLVGATFSGPTTLLFQGEVDNTLALTSSTVASNLTLNVIGPGVSTGTILNMAGNLSNAGTILIQSPANGASFNTGLGRLILDGGTGTLTNSGSLTVDARDTGIYDTYSDLRANLVNQSGGVVDLIVSGNAAATGTDRARMYGSLTNQVGGVVNVNVLSGDGTQNVLIDSGAATNSNAGTLNLIAGTLDVNSTGLTNTSTGILRGVGDLDVLGTTGGLLNLGKISPGLTNGDAGILSVTGDINFGTSGQLVIDVLGGGATAGVNYDQLAITGSANSLGNTKLVVNVDELLESVDLLGDTYNILTTNTGDLSTELFGSVAFSGDWTGTIQYLPNAIVLSELFQVPEPGTGCLLFLGLFCLGRRRTRRRGAA